MAACGGSGTGPDDVSLTGSWSVRDYDYGTGPVAMTLTLVEDEDRSIHGSGSFSIPSCSPTVYAVTIVEGRHEGALFTYDFRLSNGVGFRFEGTVTADGNQATGTIGSIGSAFGNNARMVRGSLGVSPASVVACRPSSFGDGAGPGSRAWSVS